MTEAADRADAGDCGRFRSEAIPPGTPKSFGPTSRTMFLALNCGPIFVRSIDGLEWSEDEAGVWRAAAGERAAHDEKVPKTRHFWNNRRNLSANSRCS